MRVTDPSGVTWSVRRRLVRLPRWRGFGRPPIDGSDGALAARTSDDFVDFLVGLAILITIGLAIALVWPLVLLLLELVAAAGLLLARLALGRWTVSAQTRRQRHTWRVHGRAEAGAFVEQVAAAIRRGEPLPPRDAFETVAGPALEAADIAPVVTSGHVRVLGRDDG